MAEEIQRKRGGQPGNKNAAKTHYYLEDHDEAELLDFDNASGIEGIDEEIALLRQELKKAIDGSKPRNLLLVVRASVALEKLIRTRYQISNEQRHGLKSAVAGVIKDVFIPLGVNIGTSVLAKTILGEK
jgi:hypothetical protein